MHPTAVLFGGCAAAGTPWDDSVYAMPLGAHHSRTFSAALSASSCVFADVDGWACMWSKVLKPLSTSIPGVGPVWPTARQGHTFTAVSSSKIVLFGGDAAGTLSNEVFLFDMGKALWFAN